MIDANSPRNMKRKCRLIIGSVDYLTNKEALAVYYTLIKHGFLTNQSACRVLSIF